MVVVIITCYVAYCTLHIILHIVCHTAHVIFKASHVSESFPTLTEELCVSKEFPYSDRNTTLNYLSEVKCPSCLGKPKTSRAILEEMLLYNYTCRIFAYASPPKKRLSKAALLTTIYPRFVNAIATPNPHLSFHWSKAVVFNLRAARDFQVCRETFKNISLQLRKLFFSRQYFLETKIEKSESESK